MLAEDYTRFRDFQYTAYFTDLNNWPHRTPPFRASASPKKTEIHVYIISPSSALADNKVDFLPLETYYADGTPVACNVSLRTAESTRSLPSGRI